MRGRRARDGPTADDPGDRPVLAGWPELFALVVRCGHQREENSVEAISAQAGARTAPAPDLSWSGPQPVGVSGQRAGSSARGQGARGDLRRPESQSDAVAHVTAASGRERVGAFRNRVLVCMDAITLLKNDHKTVEQLFKRFEKAGDRAFVQKRQIVDRIIEELSVHAAVEEQVFYPAASATVPDTEDVALESVEEHHVVKILLDELEKMDPHDERFDAKVTVLIENVRHHVEEEETEFFPKVREELGRNDLNEVGDAMVQAKKTAPTHPHPAAPDAPPGNVAAGLVAGIQDRVGDVVSGVAQGGVTAVQDVVARVLRRPRNAPAPTGSSIARKEATAVRSTAADATDKVVDTAKDAVSSTRKAATSATAGAKRTARSAAKGASSTTKAAKSGAKGTATSAKKAATSTTTTAKRSARSTSTTAAKAARSATTTAKRGATTTGRTARSAATTTARSAKKTVKDTAKAV
jgi:hemerythrin superfamily protein